MAPRLGKGSGNKVVDYSSAGRQQCPKGHMCHRGSEGHPIPPLLSGDRCFCRETRLGHSPAGGTICGGGSAKISPGGVMVPGPNAGGCSSCPTLSTDNAVT